MDDDDILPQLWSDEILASFKTQNAMMNTKEMKKLRKKWRKEWKKLPLEEKIRRIVRSELDEALRGLAHNILDREY